MHQWSTMQAKLMVNCLGFFCWWSLTINGKVFLSWLAPNPRRKSAVVKSVWIYCRLSASFHSPKLLKVLSVLFKDKSINTMKHFLLSFSFWAVYFYLSLTRQTYLSLLSLLFVWSFLWGKCMNLFISSAENANQKKDCYHFFIFTGKWHEEPFPFAFTRRKCRKPGAELIVILLEKLS